MLLQIAAKKYKPLRGTFIEFDTKTEGEHSRTAFDRLSAKDVLLQEQAVCDVCAKGALTCSLISNINNYSIKQLRNSYYIDTMMNRNTQRGAIKEIMDIFGKDLWNEIEAQFEGNETYRSSALCDILGSRNIKPKSLASLMRNIIKNKGFLKVGKHLIG